VRTLPIMPDEKRSEERRALPRHSVLFRTVLIDSEIEGEAAEIINIARSGFLARTLLELEKDRLIHIDIPVIGTVEANVVWCGNGLVGGRFAKPIAEPVFSDLLHNLA